MFKKILVCLDGSELSEQILPYVIEQARHFSSKIVLVEVVTGQRSIVTPVTPTGDPIPQASHIDDELVEQEILDDKAYLTSVAQQLQQEQLDVETVSIVDPFVGQAIVEYAHDNAIDMIGISTHGRSGIRRSLFGSVADHIVRESHLPILLIKPREQ